MVPELEGSISRNAGYKIETVAIFDAAFFRFASRRRPLVGILKHRIRSARVNSIFATGSKYEVFVYRLWNGMAAIRKKHWEVIQLCTAAPADAFEVDTAVPFTFLF